VSSGTMSKGTVNVPRKNFGISFVGLKKDK
jgi:hypothetical protein